MLSRGRFLRSSLASAATAGVPLAARATGGLDVDVPPRDLSLRILLAPDRRAVAPPVALDAGRFRFEGRVYRGTVAAAAMPDGREGLVNTIPVEDYLYGVVGLETPRRWPRASLEAQAIIARTFAMRRRMPARPYDLVQTQADQVYGGVVAEWPEVVAAVDATAGLVVMYAGMPANLTYMSCCGGRTADAADVWGHSFAYLRSIADPYCAASPDYRWRASVPWARLAAAFPRALSGIAAPTSVALRDPDGSGRARELEIADGRRVARVATSDLRRSLGTKLIRSAYLRSVSLAQAAGETADPSLGGGSTACMLAVEGAGRGHGVGLCQWGSRAQAAAGRAAREILAFYFPGTAIGRLAG